MAQKLYGSTSVGTEMSSTAWSWRTPLRNDPGTIGVSLAAIWSPGNSRYRYAKLWRLVALALISRSTVELLILLTRIRLTATHRQKCVGLYDSRNDNVCCRTNRNGVCTLSL